MARRFISDPTHEAFYRETNDRMPAFGREPESEEQKPLLTADEMTFSLVGSVAKWNKKRHE